MENTVKKRVDSMLIYSEQRMVEALYETWIEEHFGVFSRNSFLWRVDLNGVLPLERNRIDAKSVRIRVGPLVN